VAALEVVDFVILFDEETPVELLKKIRPHIHVKGGDYKGKSIPEEPILKTWGGEVRLLSYVEGFSTTGLLEKLKLL
jgi:bifunctional ADP-heptose synthase (sugar kinase/adenylyltransferase)